MGKLKGPLIITDLDGTLLRRDATLSDYSKRTLSRLIEDGLCFTYATARSYTTASKVMKGLPINLPVITFNGAFLVDPNSGKPLVTHYLDEYVVRQIKQLAQDHGFEPIVYAMIDGEERATYLERYRSRGVANYITSREGDARLRPVRGWGALFEGEVFYVTIISHAEIVEMVEPKYLSIPNATCIIQQDTYYPEERWIELLSPDANKGHALAKLKELVGAQRIVAFGDNLNDLPMFRESNAAYAVDNAHEDVKCAATETILCNEKDGVVKWLEANVEMLLDD